MAEASGSVILRVFSDTLKNIAAGENFGIEYRPDHRQAVATGDVDALTSVPGVGRRGAQRMLLELRDRLDVVIDESAVPGSALAEVREALAGLGYTPPELRGVAEGVAVPGASVEDMVRAALQQLAGREPAKA